jgi:hypothetical protein
MAQPTSPAAEDAQSEGVCCILLAIEGAGGAHVQPLARLGADYVAATVLIGVGDGGALPFALEDAALVAKCLRADPPFPGAADLADRLDAALDQARAQALRLVGGLN